MTLISARNRFNLNWFKRRLVKSRFYSPINFITERWSKLKLTIQSLTYNSHTDSGYIADTLMEPMFWFVDHFTESLGPVFVVAVSFTLLVFVTIAYVVGLPWWLERSYLVTGAALLSGNYLLLNVGFHYYMALITSPGHPPEDTIIPEAVSICKKCIVPKPPRAHCSVCNKCILRMDHHCPWLNNCVGHYNHCQFFMFCFFTWISTMYVFVFGIWIAYDEWFGDHSLVREKFEEEYQTQLAAAVAANQTLSRPWAWITLRHGLVVFETLSAASVFVAVGGLMTWHALLITRGETCVESYINEKEKKRLKSLGLSFRSPFDRGPRENWLVFLGFRSGLGLWQVIWPSNHLPFGNGLVWDYAKNPTNIVLCDSNK